jgi:hypothetical protein
MYPVYPSACEKKGKKNAHVMRRAYTWAIVTTHQWKRGESVPFKQLIGEYQCYTQNNAHGVPSSVGIYYLIGKYTFILVL